MKLISIYLIIILKKIFIDAYTHLIYFWIVNLYVCIRHLHNSKQYNEYIITLTCTYTHRVCEPFVVKTIKFRRKVFLRKTLELRIAHVRSVQNINTWTSFYMHIIIIVMLIFTRIWNIFFLMLLKWNRYRLKTSQLSK